jgi:hypothetical protein
MWEDGMMVTARMLVEVMPVIAEKMVAGGNNGYSGRDIRRG